MQITTQPQPELNMQALLDNTILRTALIIVIFTSVKSSGYFPDSSFIPFADSIFAIQSDTQITARRIKKEEHTYFMVTTCKTVQQPYDAVRNNLQNIDLYPNFFTFLLKADKIANKATPEDTVRMFVGGYGLYRVYYFGTIREQQLGNAYRIHCGDVDQKWYRKAWRKKVRGLIKIGSWDVDIFWTIEKRTDSTTRIGLTASQAFTTHIPNWMVSIGTNRIFKGMVKDFEAYMIRMEKEPAQSDQPAQLEEQPPSTPK